MESPHVSAASLLDAYGTTRPGEVATLRTIFKTVLLPHWRVSPEKLAEHLATLPAHALYGVLTPDRTQWCSSLQASLPQGTSYQKAYCRYVKRLIAFGEAEDMLHPDQYLVSPAWRALVAELVLLTAAEPPARRSALRCAFRRLARWATAHNLPPEEVPASGTGDRPMATFFQTFPPDRDGDFYRARNAWNLIVAAAPSLELHPWDGHRPGAIAAAPQSSWPPVVYDALTAIFFREGLGSWRDETRKGYAQQFGTYLGVLRTLGVDVAAVVNGISEPINALRFLFQGMPPGLPQLGAVALANRIIAEPDFRDEVATAMGAADSRASERNPFLIEAVTALVDAGKVTSAMNLVTKAIAINRGVLELGDRHITWLTRRQRLLAKLAKQRPSAYTLKKRIIFRHPYIWEALVRARGRLRAHTAALEVGWRQAGTSRAAAARRRWAVALRNEVLFGFMLCYPLRVANLVGMRLGIHYDSRSHHIFFPAAETKNDREIDYELPEGGSLGDLRGLVEQYLLDARPALLAGRHSDHVFVPDPRGGIRLREKAVNAILAELSRRFLADLLPDGVPTLNPHLLRHVTASYQLVVCQNLNLAAQLLNDSPSTITQAYADVLACKKEATKRFLSSFVLDADAPTKSRRRPNGKVRH